MIRESATVLRVEGPVVWVRCRAQAGCARCAEGRGCGGGLLGRLLGDRLREVRAVNESLSLEPGEQVVIGLGDSVLLRAASVMYLVPLLMMFGAAFLFSIIWSEFGDLAAVAGAVVGLFSGLWLARAYGRRHVSDPGFSPRVLERTGRDCPLASSAFRQVEADEST